MGTLMVILISLWVQSSRKPFVEHTLNSVESLSLLDCTLITTAALMMLTNTMSTPRAESLGLVLPAKVVTRSVSFNDQTFAYAVVAIMFVAFVCIVYVVISEVTDTVPFLKLDAVRSKLTDVHIRLWNKLATLVEHGPARETNGIVLEYVRSVDKRPDSVDPTGHSEPLARSDSLGTAAKKVCVSSRMLLV